LSHQILQIQSNQQITKYLIAGFAALITFFVFFPATQCSFTNWDDNFLVTQNPIIRDLSWNGIAKMFTSYSVNHYHPLVLCSYAIEYKLFGLSPYYFHLTNILLHSLNVFFISLLTQYISKNILIALFVGLVFGIHPLRVESVAWIAERKDVLSTFFMLLSFLCYIRFRSSKKSLLYLATLLLFFFSLLSKAMAVTLPLLFLLYDYYEDGKITKEQVINVLPLLALSLIFGIIAIFAQYSSGASPKDPSFNIIKSIFLVSYNIIFYCLKFFVPLNLVPMHPYPEIVGESYPLLFWLSPLVVGIIVYVLYRYFRSQRFIVFGFLFYVLSLLPVSQFIPVGKAYVADRFSYVPLFGIMLIVGYALFKLWESYRNRQWIWIIIGLIFGTFVYWGIGTRQQIDVWKTSTSLWSRVVQMSPRFAEGYCNLGTALAEEGKADDALANFNIAISFDPFDEEFYYNRGLLYLNTGNFDKAIEDFSSVITLNPQNVFAYVLRGDAYTKSGSYENAISDYEYILQYFPAVIDVRIKKLRALVASGNAKAALVEKNKLLSLGVSADSVSAIMLGNSK